MHVCTREQKNYEALDNWLRMPVKVCVYIYSTALFLRTPPPHPHTQSHPLTRSFRIWCRTILSCSSWNNKNFPKSLERAFAHTAYDDRFRFFPCTAVFLDNYCIQRLDDGESYNNRRDTEMRSSGGMEKIEITLTAYCLL